MTKNAKIITVVAVIVAAAIGVYFVYAYYGSDLSTYFFKYRNAPVVQSSGCTDDTMEASDQDANNQSDQFSFYFTTNDCFRKKYGSKNVEFYGKYYDHDGNMAGNFSHFAAGNVSPMQFTASLPGSAAYKIVVEVKLTGESQNYQTFEFEIPGTTKGGGGDWWWKEFSTFRASDAACTCSYVVTQCRTEHKEHWQSTTCTDYLDCDCRGGEYWR